MYGVTGKNQHQEQMWGARLVSPTFWGACCWSGSEQPGVLHDAGADLGRGSLPWGMGMVWDAGESILGLHRIYFWDCTGLILGCSRRKQREGKGTDTDDLGGNKRGEIAG